MGRAQASNLAALEMEEAGALQFQNFLGYRVSSMLALTT